MTIGTNLVAMKIILATLIAGFLCSAEPYETKIYDSSFSSSSKVIIDKAEIQDSKAPNMSSLLSTKANINITNTPFQPNSLYVRGGDSSQVLILIDDIPVYDASTVQRSFNLNSVSLNSVERITVIKGSQSVWYGGQALSSVIKIDTLPQTAVDGKQIDVSLGAHDFADLSGDVTSKVSDNALISVRGQYQYQNSPSPVEFSDFKYIKRKDNVEAIYLYRDDFQFDIKLSHTTDRNENVTGVSQYDFKSADTTDFISSSVVNQYQMAIRNNTVSYRPFFSIGYVDANRVFNEGVSFNNSDEQNQVYKSYLIPIRGELRLVNSENWKWDVGASFQKEYMLWEAFKVQQAQSDNEMSGTFTKLEYAPTSELTFLGGFRYDTSLNFRDVSTYQVGLTFKEFKIEHSTGYRLPSLYQLFSNKGNSGLNPEFARTFSVSHDQMINEDLETSIAVFETHVENLIAARGYPLQYYNVGRTLTRGAEASMLYQIAPGQKVTLNLGYQEPKDINTGRWLARRPLKSGSLSYSQKQAGRTWSLELVGRGERDDFKSASETVSLPGYTSLNSSYICPVETNSRGLKELSLYFRGENLLSEKYEESYGYRNPGLGFFVGLRAGI